MGRHREEKVWKEELKIQRKVITQTWLTGKCGSQANPAAGVGLGGETGLEIYSGLLALYDGFLCMFPAQHLLAHPGLLLAEQADRKEDWTQSGER